MVTQELPPLAETTIEFIHSPDFESKPQEIEAEWGFVRAMLESTHVDSKLADEFPAHLKRMCEPELLTAHQEQILFRQMNFLKFCAHRLQQEASVDSREKNEQQIKNWLADAHAIRNHIIRANTRLVMAIAKKFVTPQHTFDDLLSDGLLTLLQTVEKFDYTRGFRFSTYAYRSIARNACRIINRKSKEQSRFVRDADEWAFEQVEDDSVSEFHDQVWANVRELATDLLKKLDRRERFIIRSRFALGSHRKVRSFQFLADKLGVSKERVRQLAHRAVSKLQSMASEYETDQLFAASMV